MTRTEAIKNIKVANGIVYSEYAGINNNQLVNNVNEALDMAIEALEQEPLNDVLNEIKAEIRHFMYIINPSSSESDYACNYILQIIDKYRKGDKE